MDIEQIKKEIGLRIKSYRLSNKMTQERFGDLINLNTANISNIENGKSHPVFTTICSLIEKAGIEPNYLFSFLIKDNTNYSSLDIEIMDKIVELNEKQKNVLKVFLEEFIKN